MKKVALPLLVAAIAATLFGASTVSASAQNGTFTQTTPGSFNYFAPDSGGAGTFSFFVPGTFTDGVNTFTGALSGSGAITAASTSQAITQLFSVGFSETGGGFSFTMGPTNGTIDAFDLSGGLQHIVGITATSGSTLFTFGANADQSIKPLTSDHLGVVLTGGSATFETAPAPIPEMSSLVSFGAMLALGGLVVAARRRRITA